MVCVNTGLPMIPILAKAFAKAKVARKPELGSPRTREPLDGSQ
jgi:hypothetical protein